MASIQGKPTDPEYSIILEYSPGGIHFFKNILVWDEETDQGDFIPPDETHIQVIYDFMVHNITPFSALLHHPWKAKKSYDPVIDKEKITIEGPANQVWLVTMIGAPRH